MDQITEAEQVNQALTAKSHTETLDELAARGKKKVKVIRANDIASMITETVHRVVQDAEVLSEQDMDYFVAKSKTEFQVVLADRQREAEQLKDAQVKLMQATEELERVHGKIDAQRAELATLDSVRRELTEARTRCSELEAELVAAQEATPATPAQPVPSSDGANAELMMRMMNEMAEMKANLAQAQAPSASGATPNVDGMAAALDKISTSLDSRLDQFSKKMGISTAVEAGEVNYGALFNDDQEASLESNMDDVQLKKTKGAGIAGNLERLKKLKGGG